MRGEVGDDEGRDPGRRQRLHRAAAAVRPGQGQEGGVRCGGGEGGAGGRGLGRAGGGGQAAAPGHRQVEQRPARAGQAGMQGGGGRDGHGNARRGGGVAEAEGVGLRAAEPVPRQEDEQPFDPHLPLPPPRAVSAL